jgi:predicted DNA binding CopG/RHH family protein
VQDTGEKVRGFMKKKIKYTDEPMGDLEIVKDFLPSPSQLVLIEKNVKVTINLKESSIDYFKKVANKNHTQYQKIIRNLLDYYASHVPSAGSKKAV